MLRGGVKLVLVATGVFKTHQSRGVIYGDTCYNICAHNSILLGHSQLEICGLIGVRLQGGPNQEGVRCAQSRGNYGDVFDIPYRISKSIDLPRSTRNTS